MRKAIRTKSIKLYRTIKEKTYEMERTVTF
jgi:hypothetical protein